MSLTDHQNYLKLSLDELETMVSKSRLTVISTRRIPMNISAKSLKILVVREQIASIMA